jgi:trans-aconitate 2-methyltransferase
MVDPAAEIMITRTSQREWNSSIYHRVSQPQLGWGRKVFLRLKLRGDETVLDAGCGTGRLTTELLEALPHGQVVGLDQSENMLASAREHLQAHFGSRLFLIAADLLHLPFAGAFDGIVSTAAFHWVLDHDQLYGNLRRALRPGGWIEAQCGGYGNLQRFRNRANAVLTSPVYARFFEGFREPWLFATAEDAARKMRNAGFGQVETSLEEAPTTLENRAQYIEFVRNVVMRQHLEYLPNEELRNEFMNLLAEGAANDHPPFSLDYWRLNLRGRA